MDEFSRIYDEKNRAYGITGRYLDKLNEINLASLHPEKEKKFGDMINSITEKHYSPGELKRIVFSELKTGFKTTKQLSDKFKRSPLRLLDVLSELKRENKIDYIKTRRKSLWAKKFRIEEFLNNQKRNILSRISYKNFTKIGSELLFSRKSISARFKIYENDNSIKKHGKWWKLTAKGKNFVLGVDESGSEIK
ncbi:hypothetical protein CL617_03195 [archaeon]|nr:hypothetical protein [archaeon]|tara:strand:- start:384 stop:962 length:579 start_codon:yes stop_codon:yes gene_type:complete